MATARPMRPPFWRRMLDAITAADFDGDGVVTFAERGRRGIGWLVFGLSVGLCAYNVGIDILGPAFGAVNPDAVIFGQFFGVLIGSAAVYFEAFGFPLGMRKTAIICMIVSVGSMFLLGLNLINESRTQLLNAEAANVGKLEQADSMRDTTNAQQAMTDARADLERATKRRDDAEALRTELAVLPSGVWNARIAEIQTIIGSTPDGVKYNRTTDAMTAFVAAAQGEYDAAVVRRDAAQGGLDEVRRTVASGEVAIVEDQAREALQIDSFFALFRNSAQMWFDLRGVEPMDDPATPEVNEAKEQVDDLAWPFALGFVLVVVLLLNWLNFSLNNHRARGHQPRHHDGDVVDLDPRTMLPKPGGGATTDDGDISVERTQRRTFTSDDAPMQFDETPTAAQERLRRARERYEQGAQSVRPIVGRPVNNDDLAIREAEALELIDRAERIASIRKLEEEAAAKLKEANAPRPVSVANNLDAMRSRLQEIDRSVAPRVEPEVAARSTIGDDLRRRMALEGEFRRLDAELRAGVNGPRRAQIEERMHEIHAELVPIMQRLNEIAATGLNGQG